MKETARTIAPRVYQKHRNLLKKLAKRHKCSESEIVRRAIETYDVVIPRWATESRDAADFDK